MLEITVAVRSACIGYGDGSASGMMGGGVTSRQLAVIPVHLFASSSGVAVLLHLTLSRSHGSGPQVSITVDLGDFHR